MTVIILTVLSGLAPPTAIMGRGEMSAANLVSFFLEQSPSADSSLVAELAGLYIEECAVEGVNSDIAFAQMCLETGYLGFQGLVRPWMNNYCGLGATGPSEPGLSFPDRRTGVRAHVQHLKAYGSADDLVLDCVDPRFGLISSRPRCDDIFGLAGTWAADPFYGEKLFNLLQRMYDSALAGTP